MMTTVYFATIGERNPLLPVQSRQGKVPPGGNARPGVILPLKRPRSTYSVEKSVQADRLHPPTHHPFEGAVKLGVDEAVHDEVDGEIQPHQQVRHMLVDAGQVRAVTVEDDRDHVGLAEGGREDEDDEEEDDGDEGDGQSLLFLGPNRLHRLLDAEFVTSSVVALTADFEDEEGVE